MSRWIVLSVVVVGSSLLGCEDVDDVGLIRAASNPGCRATCLCYSPSPYVEGTPTQISFGCPANGTGNGQAASEACHAHCQGGGWDMGSASGESCTGCKSCGESAPMCGGWCPSGDNRCESDGAGGCECNEIPCGEASAPVCNGECPGSSLQCLPKESGGCECRGPETCGHEHDGACEVMGTTCHATGQTWVDCDHTYPDCGHTHLRWHCEQFPGPDGDCDLIQDSMECTVFPD